MNKPNRVYFASVRKITLQDGKLFLVHEVAYEGRDGRTEREAHCDSRKEAVAEAKRLNEKSMLAANPVVGTGGTRLCYTDREPVTVVRVNKTGTKVWVRNNVCRMTKGADLVPGGFSAFVRAEAEWEILPELEGQEEEYSYRGNGRWVRKGNNAKTGEAVTFHYQGKFYDHAF